MEVIIKETGIRKEIKYNVQGVECESEFIDQSDLEIDEFGDTLICQDAFFYWTKLFEAMENVDALKLKLECIHGISPDEIQEALDDGQNQNDIDDIVNKEFEILEKLLEKILSEINE